MPHFGWTRLAYLLFVLVVLTALVQLASLSTDSRPLASEPPDGPVVFRNHQAPTAEPHEPARTMSSTAGALPASVADRLEDAAADAPGAAAPYTPRPPVFHRPSPASPSAGSGDAPVRGAPALGTGPVCGDLENFPSSSKIFFPLPKRYFDSYEDTWGAPRPQGGHEGTDLMAPTGTPEYAVTDGTIVPVAGATQNGWNSLGGYTVMVEAAYSVGPIKKGDLFYYAHLARKSALKIGTKVRAGQVVGYAGDTGQGPEVTRGLFPPHLHLGWYDATDSRSDVVSGAMNPYPLLEWIKANGGAVIGGSDTRYCEAPQTGAPVPSTGESRWPTPDSPGVRPDLDTGSDDPKPSPVVEKSQNRAGHPVNLTKEAKPPRQRAEPAKQSGRGTKDGPAAAAKKPQSPPRGAPETKPPPPKPPTPETRPAEPPVPPAQDPPPPRGGSPRKAPASETAGGTKHYPSDEKRGAETGENKRGEKREESEEHNGDEKPEKQEPEKDPRPPHERTSPEEDPPVTESGASEPETTEPETIEPETTGPTAEVTTVE